MRYLFITFLVFQFQYSHAGDDFFIDTIHGRRYGPAPLDPHQQHLKNVFDATQAQIIKMGGDRLKTWETCGVPVAWRPSESRVENATEWDIVPYSSAKSPSYPEYGQYNEYALNNRSKIPGKFEPANGCDYATVIFDGSSFKEIDRSRCAPHYLSKTKSVYVDQASFDRGFNVIRVGEENCGELLNLEPIKKVSAK